MEKSQLWIIAIVGIVAVVAILSAAMQSNAAFVTNQGVATVGEGISLAKAQNSAGIRAHSCDADETCEMNNGEIKQRLTVGDINDPHFANGGITIFGSTQSYGNVFAGIGSDVVHPGVGHVSASGNIVADGIIQATSMNGSDNAYACFDEDGKLFRSAGPCESPDFDQRIEFLELNVPEIVEWRGQSFNLEVVGEYPNLNQIILEINGEIEHLAEGDIYSDENIAFFVQDIQHPDAKSLDVKLFFFI